MKSLKTIIIHAGLPKTGSSFLQSSLEFLEKSNAFSKVSYPVLNPIDDFQHIRSGNGLELAKFLIKTHHVDCKKDAIKAAFYDLLQEVRPGKSMMLISCELFANALPERFCFLREIMQEVCDDIKITVFIRPFIPWAWSVYNQGVKRHKVSMSFQDWTDKNLLDRFGRLMSNLFAFKLDIKPLPFSRHEILQTLLEELSESTKLANLVSNETVNRSLNDIETNLLTMVNDIFKDDKLSTLISNLFIKESPSTEVTPISIDAANHIKPLLKETIEDLQKYDGKTASEIAKLLRYDYELSSPNEELFYEKDHVHTVTALMLKAIHQYYSGIDERWSRLNKRVDGLARSKAEFDPIHYLLLNVDVLDADADPADHYKNFGKKEDRFTYFEKRPLKPSSD